MRCELRVKSDIPSNVFRFAAQAQRAFSRQPSARLFVVELVHCVLCLENARRSQALMFHLRITPSFAHAPSSGTACESIIESCERDLHYPLHC
jgi:hypothetical protein